MAEFASLWTMLRTFLAGFLSFVFIVLSVPAALMLAFYFALIDHDFYVGDEFVDSAYEVMIEEVSDSVDADDLPNLTADDLRSFFQEIISKDDLRVVIEDIFDQVANAKIAEDGRVPLSIGLTWLISKNELIVEKLGEMVVEKLPVCETAAPQNFDCLPPGMAKADFEAKLKGMLRNEFMSNMPKELAFDIKVSEKLAGQGVADFFGRAVKLFFITVGGILLLLLFLLGLVVFKPFLMILKWEGKTVAIAAFSLSLLLTIIIVFESQILSRMSGVGKLLVLFAVNLADKIWIHAVVVFVLALLVWFFAFYRLRETAAHGAGGVK